MDIAAITAQHRSHGGTLSYRMLGAENGLSREAMRSRIRRHVGNHAQNGHLPTPPALPAPVADPLPMYRDYPATLDDTRHWEQWKRERATRLDMPIVVLCLFDLHIPDHDEEALKLVTNLAFALQPDVIVFGGDMFDFDAMSRF